MIDAKTLHIGSHVMVSGVRARVIKIDEPLNESEIPNETLLRFKATIDGEVRSCGCPASSDKVEPIPITSTLLKELGFEESKWYGGNVLTKHIGEYSIRLIYKGSNEWDCNIYTSYSSCRLAMYRNLQFLHKLEAMVYMVTKTELIED